MIYILGTPSPLSQTLQLQLKAKGAFFQCLETLAALKTEILRQRNKNIKIVILTKSLDLRWLEKVKIFSRQHPLIQSFVVVEGRLSSSLDSYESKNLKVLSWVTEKARLLLSLTQAPEQYRTQVLKSDALRSPMVFLNAQGENLQAQDFEISRVALRAKIKKQLMPGEIISLMVKENQIQKAYKARTVWIKKAGEEFLAGFFVLA